MEGRCEGCLFNESLCRLKTFIYILTCDILLFLRHCLVHISIDIQHVFFFTLKSDVFSTHQCSFKFFEQCT